MILEGRIHVNHIRLLLLVIHKHAELKPCTLIASIKLDIPQIAIIIGTDVYVTNILNLCLRNYKLALLEFPMLCDLQWWWWLWWLEGGLYSKGHLLAFAQSNSRDTYTTVLALWGHPPYMEVVYNRQAIFRLFWKLDIIKEQMKLVW